MIDDTRAARPRLSIGGGRAAMTTLSPGATTTPRPRLHSVPTTIPAPTERRPVPTGDRGLASVLDPVRAHFDLTDDKADELAAFTRMLLAGAPRGMARG
jgi:hypothetical protein